MPLAAQAADYRAQLSESFNSGLAGARPSITLRAVLDNGSGGAPAPTGRLRFNVDSHHLTSSAWASLLAASPGTQLGTVTSDLSGTSSLRVLSHGTDASGAYVRAGVDLPGSTASIVGDDNLVVVIRRVERRCSRDVRPRHADSRRQARRAGRQLDAADGDARPAQLDRLRRQEPRHHVQPDRPDGDDELRHRSRLCRSDLRDAGHDDQLEQRHRAPAEDRDARRPGHRHLRLPLLDRRHGSLGRHRQPPVARNVRSGAAPRLHDGAGPDGTFVIRATLRSLFTDDGDLAMSARGRYAVASVEGGNATVYGIAGQDTKVVLSQPRFVLQRKTGGKLLHFSIRIPGADDHVRVSIKLGARTLVTGYATHSGTFSKTILKPAERGNLRVVASVPGADTAVSNATPLSR